ncbi:MAG: hypothetical protein Q9170_006226 [Blastenia crenularia]
MTRVATGLETGKYSDLTIVSRGRACKGDFQEARSGRIDLSDDDPKPLERLLQYMYTADYDENDEDNSVIVQEKTEGDHDPDASESLAAAKTAKYSGFANDDAASDITVGLQTPTGPSEADFGNEGARGSNKVDLTIVWNNVPVYALAEKYNVQPLKALTKERFRASSLGVWEKADILEVLKEVYETTPSTDRGLRESMLDVCQRYIDQLTVFPAFRQMLRDNALLALDIVDRLHDTKETLGDRISFLETELQDRNNEKLDTKRTVQSLQDQVQSAKDWAGAEKRALKEVLPKNAICLHCSKELHLHMGRSSAPYGHNHVVLRCGKCGLVYPEPK